MKLSFDTLFEKLKPVVTWEDEFECGTLSVLVALLDYSVHQNFDIKTIVKRF